MTIVAVCVYLLLATEFLVRYHFDKPIKARSSGSAFSKSSALDRGMKLMIFGLALDGVFILIRSIYRTIVRFPSLTVYSPIGSNSGMAYQELSDGWTGRIITTQLYFSTSIVRETLDSSHTDHIHPIL